MITLSKKIIHNVNHVAHAWWKKPRMMYSSLRYAVLRQMGRTVIRGFDIVVTYVCNLKCPHCNVTTVHAKDRKELTVDEIVRTVEQLREVGGFYVTFTGGEILTRLESLAEIIRRIDAGSMLIGIQSNGLLLTEEVCLKLKELQVDSVTLSFDTAHEEDDLDKVMEIKLAQLMLLRKHGFYVMFVALASHQTLTDGTCVKISKFADCHKVPVFMNFAVPQGRWSEADHVVFTKEDSITVRQLSDTYNFVYTDLDTSPVSGRKCPAFSERLHINGYGDVQPCTFYQIGFGNVREESLADIVRRGQGHFHFNRVNPICIPAEDWEYIKRWRERGAKSKRFPVPLKEFWDK
ncbi:MAG: radical SAM protein [Magnetococcales bacterium]|nr:radical SAM protein [Magnetococcales bacterium]MBF0150723.1 radical SAM protein [Magnetococcales bacterium]